MSELKNKFEEVLRLRNCPAVHALLLDCLAVAHEKGEAEGLLWAEMVRRGVEEYERRNAELRAYGAWTREGEGMTTEVARGGDS